MKKLCTALFLMSTLIHARPQVEYTSDTLFLHYNTPEIHIENCDSTIAEEKAISLHAENGLFPLKEGVPAIPYFSNSIIIPHGKTVDTVLFISESSKTKELSTKVTYSPALWSSIKERRETVIDTNTYNSPIQDPTATVTSYQRKHGVHIVSIASFPVQYSGSKNTLMIHDSYTVKVLLKDESNRQERTYFPNRLKEDSLYLFHDALGSYPQESIRSDEYDWLMISDIFNATSAAATKLKQHRESQGLRCKTVDVASIGTTAKEIRTYIQKQYQNHGIKYVLLVGDETIIPPFRIDTYTAAGSIMDSITTDLPYQCLDDEDWEAKYYEEAYYGDYTAEVQIGRILASDMFEFIYQSDKIIRYENLDSSETALKSMLGVGQNLDEKNWGKDFIENVHAVIPELIEKELLCEKDSNWTEDDLHNKINSNSFTVINHDGHASSKILMKLWNANGLTNDIPLFLKSQGCKPASFHLESETITEKLTLGPNGLFAAVLNTHYGWYAGAGNGPSQKLHEFFWQGHFDKGIKTFSGMTEYSHRKCLEHKSFDVGFLWDMFSSNYFGDPATEYRSPKGAIPISATKHQIQKEISISLGVKAITYTLPQEANHSIGLFTAQGKQLLHKRIQKTATSHRFSFTDLPLANGLYFVKIKSNQTTMAIPIYLR